MKKELESEFWAVFYASISIAILLIFTSFIFYNDVIVKPLNNELTSLRELASFEQTECIKHIYFAVTYQLIIDNKPVRIGIVESNLSLNEIKETLAGRLILSTTFGDQSAVRIDDVEEYCILYRNIHGLTAEPELARKLGWKE